MGYLRLRAPLQQAGINIVYGVENGEILPERVSEGDVVIFQREIPWKFDKYQKIAAAARQGRKPIVFDLDDLLLFLPENHPDRLTQYYAPSLLPMLQGLMEADLVTVSTQKLRDVLVNFNQNVVVLPNYLDDTLWHLKPPLQKNSSNEMLTIGYMGTESHRPDLDFITPALLDLLKRYPQKISFHFWGIQPSTEILSLPQVEWTPSQFFSSYQDFSAFFQTQSADIFIAPLVDSLFNRCKSPLKFLEYSALGAPGVYSNLETYNGIVSHGKNGFLASTLDEWTDSLIQLIENDELRLQIAEAAQATIREKWLLSSNAFRWSNAFQDAFNTASLYREQNSPTVNVIKSINQQVFESSNKKEAIVQKLTAQVTELTTQVTEHKQTIQTLTVQLNQIRHEAEQLKTEILHYALSKSWRMTRPIRIALRKLKSILGAVNV